MVKDQVAIVTGANRGIGLAVSKVLVQSGIITVMGSRDLKNGEAAARGLDPTLTRARPMRLDVTNQAEVKEVVAFAEREFGRIDILINNAGASDPKTTYASEIDLKLVEDVMRTNVIGQLAMIQAVLPSMRRNNYGRIVNVSSGFGSMALTEPDTNRLPGRLLAYRMSKAALNMMARTFAGELRGTNILVNLSRPGPTKTELGKPWNENSREPEEVVDGIVWLATLPTLPEPGPTGAFFKDRTPHLW